MKKCLLMSISLILSLVFAGYAMALDPRDAIPAPSGTKVFTTYYSYYSGHDQYVQGERVNDNSNVNSTVLMLRPTYYGEIAGKPWLISAFFPVGDKQVDVPVGNGTVHQGVEGFGDPTLLAAIWPYSNRATKNFFAFVFYATLPLGEYHNDKTINMGNNVWAFRPEIGWIKGFGDRWWLQLDGGIIYYTDNDDFSVRSLTLERDLQYYGEAHLSYDITPDCWIAGSVYYANGSQSRVKGRDWNLDKQDDWTGGLSINYRFNKNISMMVASKQKITTENSLEANELLRIKFNYAW
jgi:hypothetical protein